MLVIGDKEKQANNVAVRRRDVTDLGPIPLEKFIELTNDYIQTKRTEFI